MIRGLFQPQQTFYKIGIGLVYNAFLIEVTLTLLGLLGQDVTFERTLEGDLAGAGDLESLLGTRIGFNLWHFYAFCMIPCWRIRTGGTLMEPFGLLKRSAKVQYKSQKPAKKTGFLSNSPDFTSFSEVLAPR
jgi:hypothetical protein